MASLGGVFVYVCWRAGREGERRGEKGRGGEGERGRDVSLSSFLCKSAQFSILTVVIMPNMYY